MEWLADIHLDSTNWPKIERLLDVDPGNLETGFSDHFMMLRGKVRK